MVNMLWKLHCNISRNMSDAEIGIISGKLDRVMIRAWCMFPRKKKYVFHRNIVTFPVISSLCQKSKFPCKLSNFPRISLPDYPLIPHHGHDRVIYWTDLHKVINPNVTDRHMSYTAIFLINGLCIVYCSLLQCLTLVYLGWG